ncbi:MAG: tetratricopeptide repeat protein [Pseudomonadota bacterium]|nr:tetratricopeptide repeat protein [Pseudomonadota bacterium]
MATSLPAAASALAAAAQAQRQAGDYARAAASLERALGISPHSAELWHQLAAIRLAAGEPEQAAQLAARSNALAGDDPDLRARNRAILEAAGGR